MHFYRFIKYRIIFLSFLICFLFSAFAISHTAKSQESEKSYANKQTNKPFSPLYDNINDDGEYVEKQNYNNNDNDDLVNYYPTRIFAKFGIFIGSMYYPSNTFFNFGMQFDVCFDTKYITPFLGIKFDLATKMGYRKERDDVLYNYQEERKSNVYYTLAFRAGNQFIVSRVYNINISPYMFVGAFFYSQNYTYYRDYYGNGVESRLRDISLTYGAGVDFELHNFMIKLEYKRISSVADFGVVKRNVNAIAIDIGITFP